LNSGQVIEFTTSEVFSVRSQDAEHPFYVAGHMTGSSAVHVPENGDSGDPESVMLVAAQQWLKHYIFLSDPTYRNTEFVFVRQRAPDGEFKEVTLECLGLLTDWTAIKDSAYEFTRVRMVAGGAKVGQCDNGVHVAKSAIPFGLVVWGWDKDVSYAYPGGMSTRPINTVVVEAGPK
jgi:hypothetical protein